MTHAASTILRKIESTPESFAVALRSAVGGEWSDGILDAMGPLTGRNRIAASFYDGPGWIAFRPWEKLFLTLQGGQRRARRQILRHLKPGRTLEVGIGDGENIALLGDHDLYGVDIARRQLERCMARHSMMSHKLVWGEAELLPFANAQFDSCLSVGGFNHYRDQAEAWREMRRVTKPGGLIVIADELPTLFKAGIGHVIGHPRVDAWWLRKLGLDADFVEMVLESSLDLRSLIDIVSPSAQWFSIWLGLGYCLVDTAPLPSSWTGV